jgi:hypothetical protein
MVRVRRQITIGEVDAPAIKELGAGRDRDEHCRIAVLGDADSRGSLLVEFVLRLSSHVENLPLRPIDPGLPTRPLRA